MPTALKDLSEFDEEDPSDCLETNCLKEVGVSGHRNLLKRALSREVWESFAQCKLRWIHGAMRK